VPNPQTVDGYAEQFDIRPVLQFGGPVPQIGDEAGDFLAEGRQTAATHIVKPALRNNEGALPIVLAVEHHEDPARVKSVKGLSGVPGPPRQSHPQHIHRGSEIDDLETGFLAHRRMTPVGAHDESARTVSSPSGVLTRTPVTLPLRRSGRRLQPASSVGN